MTSAMKQYEALSRRATDVRAELGTLNHASSDPETARRIGELQREHGELIMQIGDVKRTGQPGTRGRIDRRAAGRLTPQRGGVDGWTTSRHAQARAIEMKVYGQEIRGALLWPTSKDTNGCRPGCERWTRGRIHLIVAPSTKQVLTVLWVDGNSVLPRHLPPAIARQRAATA